MNLQSFVHNKVQRENGWEYYVLVGDVDTATKSIEKFDKEGSDHVVDLKNYFFSGSGAMPTAKEIESKRVACITTREQEILNPPKELVIRTPELEAVISAGAVFADSKAKSIDEVFASLPKEKQDAVILAIKGGK